MFWKENILNMLGSAAFNTIDGCEYQLDGQWYHANITGRDRIDDKYVLTVEIPENISGTITGIRLLGIGSVIGQRSEYIVKKSGKALILKLKIRVYEGGES